MGIYIRGLDFYPALISRDSGLYQARFVDIPNCLAYGGSAVEAEINAASALDRYASFLRKHGWSLPAPSVVEGEANHRERYVAYIKAPSRRGEDAAVAAAGGERASA